MIRFDRRHVLGGAAALVGSSAMSGTEAFARPVGREADDGLHGNRIARIGLFIGAGDRNDSMARAFEDELARRGYNEGRNITIERRRPKANTDEIFVHASELTKVELDLVAAAALPFALAIRASNPSLPMVIGVCPGMVSNGFAKTLRRPGGLVTGTEELPPGLTARRLTLLKRIAPKVTRVGLLSTTPGRGGHEAQLADAERAAPRLGLSVNPYRATTLAELQAALPAMLNDGMNGLLSFQGGLALANRKLIVAFAAKERIPAIYQSSWFADSGGLMSWSYDLESAFRHQAKCVDLILRGTRPGDIPVPYPSPYYLTFNDEAARALQLSLPRDLAAKARRVVT